MSRQGLFPLNLVESIEITNHITIDSITVLSWCYIIIFFVIIDLLCCFKKLVCIVITLYFLCSLPPLLIWLKYISVITREYGYEKMLASCALTRVGQAGTSLLLFEAFMLTTLSVGSCRLLTIWKIETKYVVK